MYRKDEEPGWPLSIAAMIKNADEGVEQALPHRAVTQRRKEKKFFTVTTFLHDGDPKACQTKTLYREAVTLPHMRRAYGKTLG